MLWHPKTLQNLAMYNVFFIFGRFSIAGKLPKWPKIPFQYPLALRHPKILEKCRKHHRILVSVRNRFWPPPPPAKADIATAVIEHLVLLFCPPISTPSPPKRCGRICSVRVCNGIERCTLQRKPVHRDLHPLCTLDCHLLTPYFFFCCWRSFNFASQHLRSTAVSWKDAFRTVWHFQMCCSSICPRQASDASMIEGSLEVKLPTICTDEKQSRAEAERRERLEEKRVEEKESEERRYRCAKR